MILTLDLDNYCCLWECRIPQVYQGRIKIEGQASYKKFSGIGEFSYGGKIGICYSENLFLIDLVTDLGRVPSRDISGRGLRVYIFLVFTFYGIFSN